MVKPNSAWPPLPAGAEHSSEVEDEYVSEMQGVARTAAVADVSEAARLVPYIVTIALPVDGELWGSSIEITGASYVNIALAVNESASRTT